MIAPASRKIGNYEIRHKLGRGGMADVYLAQDTVSGGLVALKLIEFGPDPDTADFIEAERRGAELQARLAEVDERVCRIYDCGEIDGYFFVAMEYIDGQDLAEWLRRGPVIPEFAVDTAIAVGETLQHANALQVSIDGKEFHGIVHGDIKPKNIRIDAHGEVRVLDFGIAKALSLSRRLTRNDFGSVPYASPERLESGEVSSASDLWSLAVMLYEMVTGTQPYQAETTERLERMIRSQIPPPPAPDPCPEPLRKILIKALSPEPELRYESAQDLVEDLRAFRNGGNVRAQTEDLDATRRTMRREADDQTRRTHPTDEDPHETRRTTPKKAGAGGKPSRAKAMKQAMLALFAGFTLYIGIYSALGYLTYRHGQELAREIATEQIANPDEIWKKWTELSRDNPSSILLRTPRKAVAQKLVAAADRAIDRYRSSDNIVYQKEWIHTKEMLANALTLEPTDAVRGRLRLAEGHIGRINGTSKQNGALLQQALDNFNQAQKLLPNSPDPPLGLARLYLAGYKDLDKGNAALRQAEKHGFTPGKRELSDLADRYRERANGLFWDSRNVRGQDQEKTQIERARDDYQHALEIYQKIVPYGDASSRIVTVQKSLESVNFRLKEIDGASGLGGFLRRIWP